MVLLETVVRISDRADNSGAQIAHPADQIDQLVGDRIVKHSVDSEVAAIRIFLDCAKAYRRRTASVGVFGVSAKGRDFDRLAVGEHYADHAELLSDRDGAVEHSKHNFGARVGGDVVILGLDAEDSIAHTSAGENGAKAGIDADGERYTAPLSLCRSCAMRLSSRTFYSGAIAGCYGERKWLAAAAASIVSF